MAEKIFSLEYGIGGVCVLLTIMILFKVAEFVWRIREQKEKLSETALNDLVKAERENRVTLQMIELRLRAVEASISEFPKLRNDLRRFYSALKELAGDRWAIIRDEIMKDGFTA